MHMLVTGTFNPRLRAGLRLRQPAKTLGHLRNLTPGTGSTPLLDAAEGQSRLQTMHTLGSMQSARCARGAATRRTQPRRRIERHALQAGKTLGSKDKPEWTGDSLLSRFVNWCIDTPAIYGVMKVSAQASIPRGPARVSQPSHPCNPLSTAAAWPPAPRRRPQVMAKDTMVSTAQKNGVPWEAHVAELAARRTELERLRASVEDPSLIYPDYYLQRENPRTPSLEGARQPASHDLPCARE